MIKLGELLTIVPMRPVGANAHLLQQLRHNIARMKRVRVVKGTLPPSRLRRSKLHRRREDDRIAREEY